MATNDNGEPITEAEAARLAGIALVTLARWRREGRGPNHIRIGRLVRYLRPAVITWRNAQGAKAKGATKGAPPPRKSAHRKKQPPLHG